MIDNRDAAGDSPPSPESSGQNRAWNFWARTLGVLMLAYPDAKLTDQEIAARTTLYCESLASVWTDEVMIHVTMAKGRLEWKFFPTIAEINSALEREANRTKPKKWTAQAGNPLFIAPPPAPPREPMSEEETALIEALKLRLANRAREARMQSPTVLAENIRERARVTKGASPEWLELMGLPTP